MNANDDTLDAELFATSQRNSYLLHSRDGSLTIGLSTASSFNVRLAATTSLQANQLIFEIRSKAEE